MDELIVVKQLPIIEERLHTLKTMWEQRAMDAETMICDGESLKKIKEFRAETTKEFKKLEEQRKQVKAAVMDPYDRFMAAYKQCVTDAYMRADTACAQKISEVEGDIKGRCEDGLREYFADLCAVRHLDWLEYGRAGIKVDMASAMAKTPVKLRKQLADFVTRIGDSVDRINEMDDSEEIMVEFRRTLDAADAICAVQERHRRIEEQRASQEARKAVLDREAEAVRRVEALAPPVAVEPPAKKDTIKVSLILHPTPLQFEEKIRPILKELKKICDMEGIQYE